MLAFMCFCVGALALTAWNSTSDDSFVVCSGYNKPFNEEHAKTVTVYQHAPGGKMTIHNFYVDDRDSPAILRGFASSVIGDEDLQTVTPSSLYTLVWYSYLDPPAATICQVRDHTLPKPVLERDFSHIIECSLSRDGDVMPNYVSITRELCGDPVAYLPIRAYEQMDKQVVEFFTNIARR